MYTSRQCPQARALSEQTHLQVARIGHASLPQLWAEATESQLKVRGVSQQIVGRKGTKDIG